MDNQLSELEVKLFAVINSFRPKIYKDGNQWCCLYGEDIQEGICAFGVNPLNAVYNFYLELYNA